MVLKSDELRQLQLLEVEMLKTVIDICDKLHLKYYVLGGTMLGAVRHKGFIPWDDDIDIGMIREDYEEFLKKAPALLPKNLVVQNYRTEAELFSNTTKIRNINTTFVEKGNQSHNICHGVFIDIFPLDNYTQSTAAKMWYRLKRKVLSARIGREFISDKKKSFAKELLKVPLCWIWPDAKGAVHQREKLYKSFAYCGLIANFCGMWGDKEIVPAEWYGEGCNLEFEGIVVRAPKEYDKWLTQVYGNYMQLPPEEKRVSHHEIVAIDLNRPYTEYIKR